MDNATLIVAGPYTKAVEDRIVAMKGGNAHYAEPRDLALVKGEFWETRKVPASPHHFTREEFEDYLREQRFPINTLVDRVQVHTGKVRDALVRGTFVPQEVMQDVVGVEALDLAETHVRAEAEAVWKAAEQQDAVDVFERAMGYTVANGKPKEVLRQALLDAARTKLERWSYGIHKWATGGYKRVELEGHSRGVLVALRIGANNAQWVEFRDGGWHPASVYGEVHRMTYLEADAVYAQAVTSKEVSLEQARSVMGHRWQPFMQVSMASSC
jgi:hypothetical protein